MVSWRQIHLKDPCHCVFPQLHSTYCSQDYSLKRSTSITPVACLMNADGWFRSTPPRGRRPNDPRRPHRPPGFDPRLRAGGDREAAEIAATPTGFDPRLRAGGDGDSHNFRGLSRVSIHASAREATSGHYVTSAYILRFDPRLRAGGDGIARRPARSASCFDPRLRAGGDRSSHCATPPKDGFDPRLRAGGDPIIISLSGFVDGFDPRLRAGGDQWDEAGGAGFGDVSIHASAREATSRRPHRATSGWFRSTPPRGRRRTLALQFKRNSVFRSTPPRGRRPSDTRGAFTMHGFDPRLRAGGDPQFQRKRTDYNSGFDPRLRAGGDPRALPYRPGSARFDPRLRAGGDSHVHITMRNIRKLAQLRESPICQTGVSGVCAAGCSKRFTKKRKNCLRTAPVSTDRLRFATSR